MPQPCPSVSASELPHYTPSTKNNYGSVYDVTYIATDTGSHQFQRPKSSAYTRNSQIFQSTAAIDYTRAKHGEGKGPGNVPSMQLARTAQSRTSAGPHAAGNAPTGLTEAQDRFRTPHNAAPDSNWRPFKYAGAHLGEAAGNAIHGDKSHWETPQRSRMPLHGAHQRPATAAPHSHNACSPHNVNVPFINPSTTNSLYGKTAQESSNKNRNTMPIGCWGENPRDRLYSNSVQSCPVPSLGVRTYPEDEFNPIAMSNANADRCRISHRLENEGWVKWASVNKTSYPQQQLYPETDGLNRCRALNAASRVAARGGNSNKEMFGDVTARVVIDEAQQHGEGEDGRTNSTVERLQKSLDAKVSTIDRHEHRSGFSAFSSKFRR